MLRCSVIRTFGLLAHTFISSRCGRLGWLCGAATACPLADRASTPSPNTCVFPLHSTTWPVAGLSVVTRGAAVLLPVCVGLCISHRPLSMSAPRRARFFSLRGPSAAGGGPARRSLSERARGRRRSAAVAPPARVASSSVLGDRGEGVAPGSVPAAAAPVSSSSASSPLACWW